MKVRKKVIILFLILQFLFQLLIISTYFSFNKEYPKNLAPNNIDLPFKSNTIPSPYYNDFFNKYNWEFDPDYAPLQILTIVHHDETSNMDDFAYLSAIPIAIFNDSGIRKLSPIIYDNIIGHENTLEFLREWKHYNDKFGGLKRVIYIGDVSTETRNNISNLLGTQGYAGPPINFSSNNIFDLSAQISDFFWYKSDKAVLVLGNDTFKEPESINGYSINENIGPNTLFSLIDNISSTDLEDIFTANNVTLDGGAIFANINDTNNKLAIDLMGNYSLTNKWVFDTDNSTNSNFIFFPNVTYPANLSDWAIRVYNTSQISSDVVYNITFCNFTGYYKTIPINYSNTELQIDINWTDSQKDIDLWLLDPDGQLIESSDRNGYLYENGETTEIIKINYPSIGNWTLIITTNENVSSIPFTLNINFLNHSNYKTRCIESASNGAVIASLLHIPLFFTDGTTLSTYTQDTISNLDLSDMIIVEPENTINETLITELGISTITLENLSIINEYIQNISYQNDVILTSPKNGFFAPASLISAYHGGIVLPIFNDSFNFYSKALKNYKLMEYNYFQAPLAGLGPIYKDMVELSDIFHNWINNLDPGGYNRTTITVSPLLDLFPTFERAIIGRSFPGRFSGENETDDAIFICRSIFYRALNFKNITNDKQIIYRPYQRNEFWAGTAVSINGITEKGVWVAFNDTNVKKFDIFRDYCSENDSNGEILRPYSIILKNHELNFDNITQVDIQMKSKIKYSNSSIQSAGLKIWNWTALNFTIVNSTIFNSTDYKSGLISITESNKSQFISIDANDTRIEIFFYLKTTGPDITAQVNLVQFNISFVAPFAKKNILSSSISYWHNFTFGAQTYNYSEEIPNEFSNNAYIINYSTSFSNITDYLKNSAAIWYLCGLGNFSGNPFIDFGALKLMTDNDWRGFNTGETPENPIGSENPVDPDGGLEDWVTGGQLSSDLLNESLNLTHIILNNDFLGSTQLPNLLLSHGASLIIANLRENILGYSEHLFYIYIQELMKNKSTSEALTEALNRTSHIYSKHWKGNIAENSPFPNNTEDYHQFIIFGDPESYLTNSTSLLVLPGNYKPIAHNFYNISIRKGQKIEIQYQSDPLYNSYLFANVTDIDSSLNNLKIIPEIASGALFGDSAIDSVIRNNYLYNMKVPVQFSIGVVLVPEKILCTWKIYDQIDLVQFKSNLSLYSNPPSRIMQYDSRKTLFFIDNEKLYYDQNYTMGRVNQTLNASILLQDTDHNNNTSHADDENEFNVTIHLIHKTSGVWVKNLTMELSKSIGELGYGWRFGISQWNISYIFTEDDPIGEYLFNITCRDSHGQSNFQNISFEIDPKVKNWPAEVFSFVNNTNSLFRVNETLQINATFFDRDDYLDDNFSTYKENDSIILKCEGNNTVTNISINGSYFENNYQATFYNDSIYHIIMNDSDGKIRMPYSINLSNAAINYNNISEIEIKIRANISNTDNITFAGWKIYNWTSQSLLTLSNNIFNSTNETTGSCIITANNLSHFVNQSLNNRIEIFFYLETNSTTNASINYLEYNITYPVTKTGISAEIQMENDGTWINRTMTHDKIREIWQFNWVFTPENNSGTWQIYFNLTDKDNHPEVWNTSKSIIVKNHAPNWVFSNKSLNSVYRGNPIEFYGNATDLDVFNRTNDLNLEVSLNHTDYKTELNYTMNYDNITNLWTFTLISSTIKNATVDLFLLGNWSFLVSVTDEAGGYNESYKTYFEVLNNFPSINVTNFIPDDFSLFDGEVIEVWCNFSDVEYLNKAVFQLIDSRGKKIQKPPTAKYYPELTEKTAVYILEFTKDDYYKLQFRGKWVLNITLYDNDGATSTVTYEIYLKMPPILPPPPPFAWEYLIMAALIVTVILGTILVYRFYQREEVTVPASRVKAIIKKMVKEKEMEELKEEKIIKERLEKKRLKRKPPKKIKKAKPVSKEKLPPKKEKLDKLEIKNLEVRLSETLNSARQAIRKKNFTYAAELYQRAAKITSRLGDLERAKRFSERAEDLYKKGKKKLS